MANIISMQDLGKSFEAKFAMDQEIEFKIATHAQTMIAEWAAERIGLDPENSQKFVRELSEWRLSPGNKDLKAKLMADFATNRLEISENALERLISLKTKQARKKILND